jgi:hypothetical protein
MIGAVLALPSVAAHGNELAHLLEKPLTIVKIIVVTTALVFFVRWMAQRRNHETM